MNHANKMIAEEDKKSYAKCMELIKLRISAVDNILDEKVTTGYLQTNREFIYLQFRFIFELIAISSLCSNRVKYEEICSAFRKERSPKKILSTVANINPAFYPQPVTDVKQPDGTIFATPLTDGFLTVEELRSGIGICGNYLHPYNVYNKYNPPNADEEKQKFLMWRNKTMRLLDKHMIWLVGGVNLSVVMNTSPTGNVTVQEMIVKSKYL